MAKKPTLLPVIDLDVVNVQAVAITPGGDRCVQPAAGEQATGCEGQSAAAAQLLGLKPR
ncbi:hypothetical protein [Bosea sp. UC22_33]|uniref:hypothetical protein n=1 Tax=Bosea sp. UC22_33 TaxID=3350165 RepID=UPI0036718835